ncbi:MAG: hypothetical protein ABSA33_00560 [Candidatus Micrarchaeaceae archaeon]
MPARVYECDKSEVEELKKLLAYDPYLDSNFIPPEVKVDKNNITAEQKKEIEERDKKIAEAHKALETSPKGKYIFSRQECDLRDGAAFGLNDKVSYLYLNATDDFLNGAEERFKTEFKTIKRASKDEEEKVIAAIKEEQERANTGFGSIFGN